MRAQRDHGNPEDAGDDVRWAQAESVLAGSPTPDARRRVRTARTRVWVLVVSLLVLSAAAGLGLALLTGPGDPASPAATGWREVVGLVCGGLGALSGVAGAVLLVRRGRWGAAWRSPASVLTLRQRRLLGRQVLGRAPLDVRRLGLARDLASRIVDQRALVVVLAGVSLNGLGQAFTGTTRWSAVWGVWSVLFFGVGVVVVERQARRAQRFLDDHPAVVPPAEG